MMSNIIPAFAILLSSSLPKPIPPRIITNTDKIAQQKNSRKARIKDAI